jgi:hypothetical protein
MKDLIKMNQANPAEYLACCGLLELGWMLWPESSAGRFTADGFEFTANHPTPTKTAVEALVNCKVEEGSEVGSGGGNLTLTILNKHRLELNWWRDRHYKCWSGRGKAMTIFYLVDPRLPVKAKRVAKPKPEPKYRRKNTKVKPPPPPKPEKPLARVGLMEAAQRVLDTPPEDILQAYANCRHLSLDPRVAIRAQDLGFSPNVTGDKCCTYVLTELLAAVGLQRFRPLYDKQVYSYHTWLTMLNAPVAIAAGSSQHRSFTFTAPNRAKNTKFFNFATEGALNV